MTHAGRDVARAVQQSRGLQRWGLANLADWLAIPSISSDTRHRGDVRLAARWLAGSFRQLGAAVSVLESPDIGPTLVGRWAGPPGAPVLLIYGHYDVRPAGPGWTVPPFAPTFRGGILLGRGANDDKGQLFAVLTAIAGWRRAGGVPATVLVLADGAEEIGSPGLGAALRELAVRVRPELILVCDTERSASGAPTVTVSQRGHVLMDVAVDTGGPPVHSGRLGGAVADPTVLLVDILSRMSAMVDRWSSPERSAGWSRSVEVLSDSEIRRAAKGRALVGENLHPRITDGATLTIGRVSGAGGGGVVPAGAAARIEVRLPPHADVRSSVRQLRRLASAGQLPGVVTTCSVLDAHRGHEFWPPDRVLAALDRAGEPSFGSPLVVIRSGGSLPAAGLLAHAFDRIPVLLGLGTPAGGAHGPDEHLDVPGWCASVEMLTRFFGELAQNGRAGSANTRPVEWNGIREVAAGPNSRHRCAPI